jgi:WD40 repeat protein/tRNA A-37 threonylcarbamoyl transferase component Bud32
VNVDDDLPPDEQFASVLAAWDEALAAGAAPGRATGGSPELLCRLERGLACLQRLQGLRQRSRSVAPPAPDTPRLDSPATVPAATDRNLLLGVLALQTDLIDRAQFVEACTLWTTRKHVPLADLLVERGWLTAADRAHLEWLLGHHLRKHRGDAHASLAAAADDAVRHALSAVEDADVRLAMTVPAPPVAAAEDTISYTSRPGQRYTVTRLHATGGIGRVWLAYDSDLGREVALKELRPERSQDRGLANRFLHEAQVTGQLEHPGIVPVYELTHRPEDGQPFYTMRFIKGRTLTNAIRAYHDKRAAGRAEPLERVALLNAFVATCNAVAYAHSRGVIHRDLKGQNVVLGDFGEVVVLDWGFAKVLGRADDSAEAAPVVLAAAGPGHTVQGQVIGTPAYMAPEQAEGRTDRIDRRTDVYGLGAILYELLTGRPPFTGAEVQEVLRQVREAEPARPRQVWAGVPRALEAVCLRALAKEPAGRYASAGELAREVQRWLADEPVVAYPEPAPARLARWARRHQTLSAGLAVLLVSAVVGAVVVREQWARNELRVQAAEKVAAAERKARADVATAAYLKHIALAQEAVSAKQLARADELLERCEPGLRDWEWHYAQRRTHRCLHTLRGHAQGQVENQNLRCVVYRPDGRQLASAGVDGSIRIWDARTGRLVTTLPGHKGGGFRLAYRPPDGRYLASTGANDGKVRVWDTSTEKEVFNCTHGRRAVLGVAYTPDGRQFASSSWDDKTVMLWDATNGQSIRPLFRHNYELGVLAFRPDGRQLAVAASDNTVRLLDVTTGQPVHTFAGATGFNTLLAFSPDGKRLAAGGGNNRIVSVWDVTNGQKVWDLPGRGDTLPVVAFSPDNRLLAAASVDQTVRIWDAATGRALRTLRGHRAMLGSVAFSPDSRQLATAGNDAIVKVWDVTDLETNAGPDCIHLGMHPQGVRSLAFNPDTGSLASAGPDGTVRIWDATTVRQPHPLLALGSPPLVLPTLVNARVAATGPEVRTLGGHRATVVGAVFSPDGKRMASASEDGMVVVRDAATGREVFPLRVPAGPARSVVFSADGQSLATASGDRTVTIWDAASGREVRTFHGGGDVIHGVAFSPDGRWLAAADVVGTLKVWDTATGEAIFTRRASPGNPAERLVETLRAVPHSPAQPRSASCVVFSSDGKRLAWTGEDSTVAIWDLDTLPSPLPAVLDKEVEPITCQGHTGLVTSLVFSPNGKRLCSAGEDGVVKLWDSRTGQEALTLRGHPGVVRSVAFSPDARLLAAAGDDGTITIWDGTPLDRDPGR